MVKKNKTFNINKELEKFHKLRPTNLQDMDTLLKSTLEPVPTEEPEETVPTEEPEKHVPTKEI